MAVTPPGVRRWWRQRRPCIFPAFQGHRHHRRRALPRRGRRHRRCGPARAPHQGAATATTAVAQNARFTRVRPSLPPSWLRARVAAITTALLQNARVTGMWPSLPMEMRWPSKRVLLGRCLHYHYRGPERTFCQAIISTAGVQDARFTRAQRPPLPSP